MGCRDHPSGSRLSLLWRAGARLFRGAADPTAAGPTLDCLAHRQARAWLYAVNIYIAKQGEWSFSYLNHFCARRRGALILLLVLLLAAGGRRPRALIAVSLAVALCAMLARLTRSLMGLSWWTTYTLTPFRLDGLALGAFVAVTARQPGGLERLARALPLAVAVIGGGLCWQSPSSGPPWCRARS